MNNLQKNVLKQVFGAHMGVLFLMLFIPFLKGCFHPKPKIITFIDLSAEPPPPPEPVAEPEPPKPVQKIPLPVTNAPPKKVETKKPEPKKPAPKPAPKKIEPKKPAPKPKTLEERLADVRQNNRVTKPNLTPAPSKPALDLSGFKSALNNAATGSGSGSPGGTYSPFAGYYNQVKQQMYSVWQQPTSAPIGLTAVATIQIGSDGAVYSKSITRRSGNILFDQSVQNALNDTARLPVPPPDLPSRTIEIEFALAD